MVSLGVFLKGINLEWISWLIYCMFCFAKLSGSHTFLVHAPPNITRHRNQ